MDIGSIEREIFVEAAPQVVFDGGTRVRMTETGFRERDWETAVLEEQYRAHVTGWDFYLPRLAPYVATLRARR